MDKNTNIKIAIDELHKAFYNFNRELFNSKLPEPAILIQNKGNRKNVLGWCSTKEIWINKKTKDKKYEINLVAEYLDRPLNEVMGTLLHEMVHLYNLVNNIKDTSRAGTYHNKRFKESAETFGLIIEYHEKIGWSLTTLQDSTKDLISSFDLNEEAFSIARIDFDLLRTDEEGEGGNKKKTSSRKYICPGCGAIVRATKEINIICGDCRLDFQEEEN